MTTQTVTPDSGSGTGRKKDHAARPEFAAKIRENRDAIERAEGLLRRWELRERVGLLERVERHGRNGKKRD